MCKDRAGRGSSDSECVDNDSKQDAKAQPLRRTAEVHAGCVVRSFPFTCSGQRVTKFRFEVSFSWRMLQEGNGAAVTESGSEQSWLFWSTIGSFVSSISVSWLNIYPTAGVWMRPLIYMAARIYLSPSVRMRSSYNVTSGRPDQYKM